MPESFLIKLIVSPEPLLLRRFFLCIERATTNFFLMLAENYIVTGKERIIKEKLIKDQDMIAEITDLIVSDCGAVGTLVDDIVVKYIKKYEK
jgi:hypothetical protein